MVLSYRFLGTPRKHDGPEFRSVRWPHSAEPSITLRKISSRHESKPLELRSANVISRILKHGWEGFLHGTAVREARVMLHPARHEGS